MAIELTVSGENIHITNSKERKAVEFALYGKAKQNTTTGKNLLKNTDIERITSQGVSVKVEKSRLQVVGTFTADALMYANGGYDSTEVLFTLEAGDYVLQDGLYLVSYNGTNRTNKSKKFTVIEPFNVTAIGIYSDASTNNSIFKAGTYYDIRIDMMLNSGTTALPFEPYTNGASPNPQYPQPIEVSGESGSVEVKSVGNNWLNATLQTTTKKGITCTSNGDGTYTLNGIAEDATDFYIVPNGMENNNVYDTPAVGKYLCGIRGKTTNRDYQITVYGMNGGRLAFLYSDSSTECVKIEETENIKFVYLWIYKGAVFNNVVIKPMITTDSTANYDSYEPYKETLATIPTENGLAGIKVSSNGNYTDSNGQQWICDEVVKYADGSGEYVNRIGKEIFDGSDDESWSVSNTNMSGYYRNISTKIMSIVKANNSNSSIPNIMCTHYGIITPNGIYTRKLGITVLTDGMIGAYDENYSTNDISLFKEHLSSNPITVYYELANPIRTPLTAEEIAEIEKLHTFYPITNISNDFDCGMKITYVSTLIEFKEPKTDWTEKSRFNIEDYNRIKNNLEWLYQKAVYLNRPFEIEDMGEDIFDYISYWKVSYFNAFEDNIEVINKNILTKDYGTPQKFYENGAFIRWTELNRIESAILSMKNILDNHEKGLQKIPFVLGRFKEIRV